MGDTASREVRLKSRPVGIPQESDFELAEVRIPEPAEGQILVRNIYMSVDPYMRGRMIDRKSYVPPFKLGKVLEGHCVGQVVKSNKGLFQKGDYVSSMLGWRECYLSEGGGLFKIDPAIAPIQAYLGVLGLPGLTAYTGLLHIGQPKEGETLFVSAAAGAVGGTACQIAKIKGLRVIGSAGSDEKVLWLKEKAGIDAAFNYRKTKSLTEEVSRHCPKGIDIYFDNVGGDHLEAALEHMNEFGRIVLCGMISQYNATELPPGPRNLFLAISKKLTMRGFIVSDHLGLMPQFLEDMGRWVSQGRIHWKETVFEGIESSTKAFRGLFTGSNLGKMLVRLGPDPAAG